MSLLHQSSAESLQTGLDIFSVWPTQTSIESGMYIEYLPLGSVGGANNIEFFINQKSSEEYIDLSNTYLHVRVKITNEKGEILADDTPVAPVNNFLHSLFSQVDISLNNTLVTPSENTYAYRAYIENTLNYDRAAKKSQLSAELYYRDSSHFFDDGDLNGNNSGFKVRAKACEKSRTMDMIGKLHCDVMNMSRYIINGVDIKFRLTRSNELFHLFNVNDNVAYKTTIEHISMFVRKIKLNPVVSLAHNKALETRTAKYPLKRVSIKTFSIPTGQLSATKDNLFLAQLPTRLIVCFVDSDAFNGTYKKNPFNFKHQNLSYMSLFIDGRQCPSTPLTPNFKTHRFVRSYHRLFSELGLATKNEGNYIEYRDFDGGNALFAFDLSPSILDGNQCELIKSGNLRLELKFSEALPAPIHVIVYGEIDSIIEINKSREVITDYTT